MSDVLRQFERHAVLLEEAAPFVDEWAQLFATSPFGDMASDARMPRSARESLKRSREFRLAGMRGPQAGFGPFWQMVDGSIMSANQTAVVGTTEVAMFSVAQYSGWAAGQLRANQLWYLRTVGICTTPGSSQGNLTLTPRYGTSTSGVSLTASAATALAASATNAPWVFEYLVQVRSIGNAGTNSNMIGNGIFQGAVALIAASTGPIVLGSTASVGIDTTIASGLFIGVTMGSASDSMVTMASPLTSLN